MWLGRQDSTGPDIAYVTLFNVTTYRTLRSGIAILAYVDFTGEVTATAIALLAFDAAWQWLWCTRLITLGHTLY